MTISEVSKKYDISTDTLRYYERIGLLPPVPRTKSGLRDYDDNSCKSVEFIKCMRNAGLPIEALISRIEEMQSTLSRLDRKIEMYKGMCSPGCCGKK